MSESSETISRLYKSRKNLLDLLSKQNYNTKDYEEFSVNELHTMFNNKQLDMLINNDNSSEDESKKKGLCKISSR